MKRTIKEYLNSENHIQIGRQCITRMGCLLGCDAGTVKTEGNTSFIDFKQNSHLDLPFCSSSGDRLSVWQTSNKIMYTGIDESNIDDLAITAQQMYNAGCEDVETAISAKMLIRKSVVFDIAESGMLLAECSLAGKLRSKFEFRNVDELAEFIYNQIKNDYEKCDELARKLRKAIKICELKFEKDKN